MLARLRGGLSRAFPPVAPLDRRARVALSAILGIGALLRLAWVLLAAEQPVALHDPALYLNLGNSLSEGEGFAYMVPDAATGEFSSESTTYYPPGYPLTLGAVFWLVGLLPFEVSAFGAAVALNLVLSVATVALVFELGRRLVGVQIGLVAAAVMALWPNLVFHTGVLLTETLFLFLLVLMLLVALASPEVARSPGVRRMVAVGLLFGLVGLVRPTSFVVAPLFLLLWWRTGVVTALRRTALVGVAVLVVVLPWTARNYAHTGSFVLVSTNMGDNVCIGHAPEATGGYGMFDYCFDADPLNDLDDRTSDEDRADFEVRRQSETLDRALRSIRDDPARVVTLMPAKLRYTLDNDVDGLDAATDYGNHQLFSSARMDILELGADTYYVLAMVAGVAGTVLLLRRDDRGRRGLFLVAVAGIHLVPPLLTFGDPRFKMPIYPVVAVCAGLAVVTVIDRLRSGPTAGPAGAEAEPDDRDPASADRAEPATTAAK